MAQRWYFRTFTFLSWCPENISLVKIFLASMYFCGYLLSKTGIESALVKFKMHFSGSRLNFLQCSRGCSSLEDVLLVWKNLTWFRQPLGLSKHKLIRSDYLSGSGQDLWGRTADQTKRPCSGSSVVFWQVPRVNSRYRTQQKKERFGTLDFLPCFSFLKISPRSE